jgi:hypothetical protein
MPDHGLRLRRLSAPTAASTTTAPPSSNHGTRPPVGGCVGGPVEASPVLVEGETDGASACIGGDGVAIDVVSAKGVALATSPAGGAVLRDGGAAVGARTGGQTWLNETVGGRVPVPTE